MPLADRPNPFTAPGLWLKGAIHVHTNRSDGQHSPEDVLGIYRDAGYDFLIFGDHWKVTTPVDPAGRMIVIPGAEFDAKAPGTSTSFHLMAAGLRESDTARFEPFRRDPVGLARALGDACDLLTLAHPYWSSVSTDQAMQLAGVGAVEVYNHGCEVDQGVGFSMYPWDQLLTRGRRLDGLAVDDAHFRSHDWCGGWVMVKVPRPSPENICAALRAGEFYSTMGPAIHAVEFTDPRRLRVTTSPARNILFRGQRYWGSNVSDDTGAGLTFAAWDIPTEVTLVRVEITDAAGLKAWTNPFWLAPASRG